MQGSKPQKKCKVHKGSRRKADFSNSASGPKDVPIATFGGPTQFIYLGILTDNNKKMSKAGECTARGLFIFFFCAVKCEGLPNKAFLDFVSLYGILTGF